MHAVASVQPGDLELFSRERKRYSSVERYSSVKAFASA
jgi:hypothetical protein